MQQTTPAHEVNSLTTGPPEHWLIIEVISLYLQHFSQHKHSFKKACVELELWIGRSQIQALPDALFP